MNRRRIAGGFGVSLALHVVLVLLLVLRLKWEPEEELLPPPATVDMVFEGGRPEGPTTPNPAPDQHPDTAPAAPRGGVPGSAAPPPPPEPVMPPPVPPPPETVTPPREPVTPPEPANRPKAPEPPPEPAPPKPPEPVPVLPPPEPVPLAPPPPPLPAPPLEPGPTQEPAPPPAPAIPPAPLPPPPPPEPPPPEPPQPALPPPPAPTKPTPSEASRTPPPPEPRQQTWPPLRPPTPARRPSDFPAPMDFSFGPKLPEPGAAAQGKPLLSLGLPKSGPEDATPYSMDTDAEVGPDWRNALSEWVEQHSYYPAQAAAMGQQGTARVVVKAMPDGRVVSVELEKRSGSPWLDLALQGMFRGAKLPPMPKSVGTEAVPFHFTMHYIIIH